MICVFLKSYANYYYTYLGVWSMLDRFVDPSITLLKYFNDPKASAHGSTTVLLLATPSSFKDSIRLLAILKEDIRLLASRLVIRDVFESVTRDPPLLKVLSLPVTLVSELLVNFSFECSLSNSNLISFSILVISCKVV